MESVKLALMKRIQDKIPGIGRIDEDYGQLESEDDQYPLVFPLVLISNPKTEWQTECSGRPIAQRGMVSITIRLAVDCYDDTHLGSTTEGMIQKRELINSQLISAIHGFKLGREASAIVRIESAEYPRGGGIKVYETTYQYIVREAFMGMEATPR